MFLDIEMKKRKAIFLIKFRPKPGRFALKAYRII